MKTINSQRIELKGAGICQINGDVLTIKGKDLRCKEIGNTFYIESGSSYIAVGGNNSIVVVGNGNVVSVQKNIVDCAVNIGQNVVINGERVICNGIPVNRENNTSSDLETLKYKLTNPIRELKITGAGDFIVNTNMFDKDEVEITLKGSGDFNINSIKSKNIYIDLIGSGDIEVGDIEADNLIVRLKGSGDVEIDYAKAKNLDVKLLGSGDIEINGDFKNITKTKIGSGDIVLINRRKKMHTHKGSSDSIIFLIFIIFIALLFLSFFTKNIAIDNLKHLKEETVYSGKIFLNKKYCYLSNNKECSLEGFWKIDDYSSLFGDNKKMIFFMKKTKEGKLATIPLIYNIDHPFKGQIKNIEIYKEYTVKCNEDTNKIVEAGNDFKKDFKAIYGKEI